MLTEMPLETKRRGLQIAAVFAAVLISGVLLRRLDSSRIKVVEIDYGCGLHVDHIKGQDVYWELPKANPVGVIFFFHGCNHGGGDPWPPSSICPSCLGLPEEARLRRAALRRRLALVGVSSLERVGKRCWAELRRDGGRNVAAIVRQITAREGLKGLPLYTMGASSGGQMALTLPRHLRVQGVYAQVRGVDAEVLKLPKGRQYPPTAFVHMPRDPENAAVIEGNIKALRAAGTTVLEVKIPPRPVTVEYLSSRSILIDEEMAAGIVAALWRAGILDDAGWLKEPPRPVTEKWAPAVQKVIGNMSLVKDESHVGELVNLAWAKHELVSDEAEAIIAWLQGGGKGGLGAARRRAEEGGEWWEGRSREKCFRCIGVGGGRGEAVRC